MRAIIAGCILIWSVLACAAQGRDASDRASRIESNRDKAETRIDRIYEQDLKKSPQATTQRHDENKFIFQSIQPEGAKKPQKRKERPKSERAVEPAVQRIAPR